MPLNTAVVSGSTVILRERCFPSSIITAVATDRMVSEVSPLDVVVMDDTIGELASVGLVDRDGVVTAAGIVAANGIVSADGIVTADGIVAVNWVVAADGVVSTDGEVSADRVIFSINFLKLDPTTA